MVTRSARVCIVSSALMSFSVPGPSPITLGHSMNAVVRKAEKIPPVAQKNRCPANSSGRKFTPASRLADGDHTTCPSPVDRTTESTNRTSSRTPQLSALPLEERAGGGSSQRRKPSSSSRRRHLGTFALSAYTQYHSPPRRTASGTLPTDGRTVAVDPAVIPLGTKLHIEGVGVRIAEDTGRKIKGKKLDLFLSSLAACTRFGVRSLQVYILD